MSIDEIDHTVESVQYLPGRISTGVAIAVLAIGWLVTAVGLVGLIGVLPDLGVVRSGFLLLFCGSPPIAIWMTNHLVASQRMYAAMPSFMLRRRCHGTLGSIADSERRPLRPVGTTAREVATRTDVLLEALITIPSVRIFRGVRSSIPNIPLISHAISAGRRLVLIESVAWPPGEYTIDDEGRVHCDRHYIGQTIAPVREAVRHWRRILPSTHGVKALIVVHRTADGEITLPWHAPGNVVLTLAEDVVTDIRRHVRRHRRTVSRHTIAALIAATDAGS